MTRILLSNQVTFENRGCEAIIRSTVSALRAHMPDATFLVPSSNASRDRGQWPEASDHGVTFVPAFTPKVARYWVRAQMLPPLQKLVWPFPLPSAQKEVVRSADLVLSVGGDNYSLDYRLPTRVMALDAYAMDLGKPVFLWGASVGPFENAPAFVPTMQAHLQRMSGVWVRETISQSYLTETLGLSNVHLMADPAFVMERLAVDGAGEHFPAGPQGTLGLNVSPLIERYAALGQDLSTEVVRFVEDVVDRGYGVVLIPHVEPIDGSGTDNDRGYMQGRILARLKAEVRDQIKLLPAGLNAPQLKAILAKMRFFIGARTHATIGAMSSGVPTISIAYSVKARGINRDISPDLDVVLPTDEVSSETLNEKLSLLETKEQEIRAHLAEATERNAGSVARAAAVVLEAL